MCNDKVRKKMFYQIPVLFLIFAISIPMITAPMMSNIFYLLSITPLHPISNFAYAEGEDDGSSDSSGGDDGSSDSSGGDDGSSDSSGGDDGSSDSSGGDDGSSDSSGGDDGSSDSSGGDDGSSDSSGGDDGSSDSSGGDDGSSDPSLASTPSDPSLTQEPVSLTDSNGNSPASLVTENGDQDLDCNDVADSNFEVSSNDPNGFDGDNDGIGCETGSSSSETGPNAADLDCNDVADSNFEVSSNDPNGFDGDNDGIGCESNGNDSNGNFTTSPTIVNNEGPDGDCLFDPNLPKCASVDGDCPDGFFQNGYEQCVPVGGCPDGYHTVDDDETGTCIPNSDGCPDGMIFRPNGETCGYKEDLCQDNADLDGCVETPQECNNGRDDDVDGLTDSEDPDCEQQPSCDPSYPDHCISSPPPNLKCDEIQFDNFKVNPPDPHGFDRDNDGIGCEDKNGGGGNGNGDDNDNNGNDNNGGSNDQYIIKASSSCDDISDTIDLSSEQIDSQEVRIIAYFDNCDLKSASLHLNIIQNSDIKLVAAQLENGLTDAIEVDMNPIDQSPSNSNTMYEATITNNQEGHDLDTGELKTLNNVNGIVLWNDDEDEPIEFADNNFVEANIDFFN